MHFLLLCNLTKHMLCLHILAYTACSQGALDAGCELSGPPSILLLGLKRHQLLWGPWKLDWVLFHNLLLAIYFKKFIIIIIIILGLLTFIVLKYILLIMLLQLSPFFSPHYPPPFRTILLTLQHHPHSSRPWVVHISSLASPFPILFLTFPCLFSTYHLCFLFPVPFLPVLPFPSPMITVHVISISVILFLF